MDTLSPSALPEARGAIYYFLSSLLLEPPTEKLLSALSRTEIFDNLAALPGEASLSNMRELLNHLPDSLARLTQEFNDLFIVPLGRYITPYEAVYRDEREVDGKRVKGLLAGESTIAVQKSYREAGIAIRDDFLELPDHAGVELSFMSYLCSKQSDMRKAGEVQKSLKYLKMQKRFYKEHLTVWMPRLCARMNENSEGPFYKGVSRLIEAFLILEAETLSQTGEE